MASSPSSPLRALFVNGNLGGHVTLHQNLRQVLGHRHDIKVLFVDVPRAGRVREIIAARIPVLARLDLDLKQLRFQLAVGAWVGWNIRRAATQFDVVHIHPHDVAFLSVRLVRSMPTIVSLDAPGSLGYRLLPYRRPTRWTRRILKPTMYLERRLFNAATLVIAQSEWAARALKDDYGVDPQRIRVFRYGIVGLQTSGDRASRGPGQPAELPQITFVGRTMGRKGGWWLLKTFRARLHGRALLNLVTQEPVEAEAGIRVFNDFQPGDPRLADLLAASAVFALPTDTDMSPYSILEAMSLGVPVVSCDVGGVAEIVDDGVTGLLVSRGDDHGLADALLRLVEDEDLRRRMSEAAKTRFGQLFDASATADDLVAVMREAVDLYSQRRRGRIGPSG